MNKLRMLRQILLLFIVSGSAMADPDGPAHLTFSGVLVRATCQLDTASAHQLIDFGTIPVKNFYRYGHSEKENIVIKLTKCVVKAGQKVSLQFQGREDKKQPGLLAVEGDAQGIAIKLEDEQGKLLRINQDNLIVPLNSGYNEIHIQSYVQSAASDVKNKTVRPGGFHSVATFILQYP